MRTVATCSHCHEPNELPPLAGWPCWCKSCGHRADVARLDCNCERCRARKAGLPTCQQCGRALGWDRPSGVCSERCLRLAQGFAAVAPTEG